MARSPSFPRLGSRSDTTRKHVLGAIAEARRRGLAGEARKSDVLRLGDVRGAPFSRRSLDKYGGTAFRAEGRFSVLRHSDPITRRTDVITYQGGVELDRTVRGSADASKVGHWQNALRTFLREGDEEPLRALREKDRTIDRGRSVLVNDPDEIQTLADSGRLDEFRTEAGS